MIPVKFAELKFRPARTALFPPAGVESAACCTTNIHRPCKPTRDERTNAQYPDQDGGVQKKIFQTQGFSTLLGRYD